MVNKMKLQLNGKLLIALGIVLLIALFAMSPAVAHADSEESTGILQQIKDGQLDGKPICTVVLNPDDIEGDKFTSAVQAELDKAGVKGSETLTRIVIPDGEYQLSDSALKIKNNTILDLRGVYGSETVDMSDDYRADGSGNVIIYQPTRETEPHSLRCGEKDDDSYGYDWYENMTVLGGTFVGKRQDGTRSTHNACNIRFGHATNLRLIGVQVLDNYGGHHMEIGACKDVLVADCYFRGHMDGVADDYSDGESIEAIQIDVSHQEKRNFSTFGREDDLATCDMIVTDCEFDDVRRGVGMHHSVFGSPYKNIVVKENTFRNIVDRAICLVYAENAEVKNNIIESASSGITFSYMAGKQHYQPNEGEAVQSTEKFISSSSIHDNTIYLDDTWKVWGDSVAKFGIRVGGEVVTEEVGLENGIPVGTYELCQVEVKNNTIGIANDRKLLKEVRSGVLVQYAGSCNVDYNKIDLSGCDEDGEESYGGILIAKSTNVGVTNNTVDGITNGENNSGILISACDGTESKEITGNIINSPNRYGINCYNVTNEALCVYSNQINSPGAAGICVAESTINEIRYNTIKNSGDSAVMIVNNSSVVRANNNIIESPAGHGLIISNGSYAKYSNGNTITSPQKSGIMVYDSEAYSIHGNNISNAQASGIVVENGAKASYIDNNTITSPTSYGILINKNSNLLKRAQSNTITTPGHSGVMITGGSSAADIKSNTINTPTKNGIRVYGTNTSATNINENNINKAKAYGVIVESGAKVTYINSNKITSPTQHGIFIYKNSNLTQAKSNTITTPGNCGVMVSDGSYAKYISTNTITTPTQSGVRVYGKNSEVYSIFNNAISKAKAYGVIIENGAKATYINENTITSPTKHGIFICKNSDLTQAKLNEITTPGGCGVMVSDGSYAKYVSTNTINNPTQNGVRVYGKNSDVYSIFGNSINNAKAYGVLIENGAKATYINENKIKASAKHGIYIYKNSNVQQAKANTITKPGGSGIAISDSSNMKYVTSNEITTPAKSGVMVYNSSSSTSIYGNKVTGAVEYGVVVSDSAKATTKSKVTLVQNNTFKNCKKINICNSAYVNAIVSNTSSGCGNSNKVYIKEGLSLNNYEVSVAKGKTYTIPYTKASSATGSITWSSDNTSIAAVDKNGKVTGKKAGTTYIKAKLNGVTVKAKVMVK